MAENASTETTLGYLHCVIDFTPEMKDWLEAAEGEWFADEEGDRFLEEHQYGWQELLREVTQEELELYFDELGVLDTVTPVVSPGDSYVGCLDLVVVITAVGAVGALIAAYPAAKEMAKDLRGGLRGIKRRIARRLEPVIEEDAGTKLEEQAEQSGLEPLPDRILWIIFVMDTRPLDNLPAD